MTPDYPKPPFPAQKQPTAGSTDAMQPRPDHGETSYKGSGAGRRGKRVRHCLRVQWQGVLSLPLIGENPHRPMRCRIPVVGRKRAAAARGHPPRSRQRDGAMWCCAYSEEYRRIESRPSPEERAPWSRR
jgi:hypothetical protein